MWMIELPEQKKEREATEKAQLYRMLKEGAEKVARREQYVKAHTCPHCGRCDPIPPWLY